jgi:hypothetical protein
MPLKLGKLDPKLHAKTLLLSNYVTLPSVPPPPGKVFYEYKVPADHWEMFANDEYGDCTCAASAHMVMLATAHTSAMVTPTLDDVLAVYAAVAGFSPGPPPQNDNGAAITDVLEYRRTHGISGHNILGWAQVDHGNLTAIKQALYLFGGLDIGVQMPSSAMDQFDAGEPWDIVADSPYEGGHSIPLFGYGRFGATCVTWGKTQQLSWPFFIQNCDECYAVITEDWINQATQQTPEGFALATLQTDLAALKE